ncbi:MAG: hypothetical protein HGA65_05350, partial [Oscillochloris sp.]|nr:hypothetical protein [Oscillochloris sp.]
MLARTALRAAQLALALLAVAYLIYFADHARQLLTFSYPLDYGEGPLLAQVDQLRAGTPIWQLYRDPAAPPYLVINYPPLYLLLCAGLAQVTGSPLLAGRLTSLGSAIGAVMAIALLSGGAGGQRPTTSRPRDLGENYRLSAIGLSLLFLTVPIVREWASLMRVDMLGLCLGLWGLVVLGRPSGRRWPLLAGLLLLASLFTKPSLLAAPIAATSWLLWEYLRAPRGQRARPLGHLVALVAPIALGGGLLLGLLQAASGDWFTLHVVAANANRWDAELAQGFWQAQIALRWPLAAAALLALALAVRSRWAGTAPALLYTLAGCLTAAGVGKVGAYSNYFLELYAGLIWLVAAGGMGRKRESQDHPAHPMSRLLPIGACLLQIASLLYYAPLWDPTWPRQAGLVTPSPPRLALGRYGLWADARREADLLAAFGRVDQALDQEVRAAGQIFTDLPGTAAASGAVSRMQVFEARQLIDQGLSDQSGLLYDLANGEPPLAV